MEEIKDRLKELRKALNLKQREVADRLEIRVGVIGSWESGCSAIPRARIYQICNEYHVRREWLESGKGEMFESETTEEDKRVAVLKEIFASLPEDLRETIKRVVNES